MKPEINPVYRFGNYLLEPSEHCLTRDGEEVPLRPKTFEVLVYLVERHGHRVTKEELFAAIWPETFVTEKVLRHSIWEIRGVLNNRGEVGDFIKTIPKVGYRFDGSVKEMPAEAVEVVEANPALRTSIIVVFCCSLLVVALWHSGLFSPKDPAREPEIESIAVLPFACVTKDEESQSLAVVLGTYVSSSLSRVKGLTIKPTVMLARYRGKEIDPETVLNEQDVSSLLVGSVETAGDNILVTASLIEGRGKTQIWADSYNGKRSGLFIIQKDIVRHVAEALRLTLSEQGVESLVRSGTANQKAHESYLIGAYRYRRWIDGDIKTALNDAIESFEQAIELDPEYQAAYMELASIYFGRARSVSLSEEDYNKAREHFEKVIELNDATALAHQARARLLWQYDRQWRQAEEEYSRAAELDPSLEAGSTFDEWMCRPEEVKARAVRLQATSDSLSPFHLVLQANIWLWAREYDQAAERAEKALELDPELFAARWVLGQAYQQLGEEEKAFDVIMESERIKGIAESEIAATKEVFQESGLLGVQRRLFDRWKEKGSNRSLAAAYAKFGEDEEAFGRLEKLWEQPLFGMDSSPLCFYWDPLRDDPRFEQLLRKQNLPEEVIQRHLALH